MVMVGTLPGETNRYNQMAFRAANQNNLKYTPFGVFVIN